MARHRTLEEKAALKERAAAMRAAGVGAARIATELGIGQQLCRELLADVPKPASLARPNAKDEHREAAVALRREGRSYDEIRRELGVSKGTLSLWLRGLPAGDGVAGTTGELPSAAELARQLREEGWLLREIAAELGVSVKTAHVWTRGLPVPARATHGRSPEEVRAMNRARWDATLAERETERRAVRDAAAVEVGALSPREVDLLGVAIYWCEGSKSKPWRRDERLNFINSDPDVIRLWVAWLHSRGVALEDCWLSVSIHESADVQAATAYWANVLGVDVALFAKPVLKRHNPKTVRKNTGETYVGCLAIYARQSRRLYQDIEGRWQGIAQALASHRSRVA